MQLVIQISRNSFERFGFWVIMGKYCQADKHIQSYSKHSFFLVQRTSSNLYLLKISTIATLLLKWGKKELRVEGNKITK